MLATLGLIVLAPAWAERLRARRVPRGVAEAVAVPAAAALVTAPVIAALSGGVSLVSVPANLLAAPAVAPATVLGVLAAVVSPVSAGAAEWLVRLAGLPVALAGRGRHPGGAACRAATVTWPGGVTGGLALAAALVAGVAAVRSPLRRAGWPGRRGRCGGGARFRSGWWRPAGRRPAGSSSPAPSARATRWWCAPVPVRRSSWTPVRSRSRSTAACAGSACGRCRCWSSATCTPTTSAGSPAC